MASDGRVSYPSVREVWHEPADMGKRLLDYLRMYEAIQGPGQSPTYREIELALGTSGGHISYWVDKLEREGKIKRLERGTTRNIALCKDGVDDGQETEGEKAS